MLNIVMNALAKGFFRAFIFFCIWFLGYLFWRLMSAKNAGAVRPLWLDIVIAAGVAGLLGAISGVRYHRLDMIVTPVVFIIGVWIAWSCWKKRRSAMSDKTDVAPPQSGNVHIANPFKQDRN